MLDINLLNFIFINFIIIMVIFGGLIILIEPYLPTVIKQSFRYGKMSHSGAQNSLVSMLEIPKSWFRHFYAFSLIWSTLALILVVNAYVLGRQTPEACLWFLDLLTGSAKRPVQVRSTEALVAIGLITLQCCRRFYETHFIQIFSSKSRINLSHYLVGFIHYFAAITGILANAEGFVRGSTQHKPALSDLNIVHMMAVTLFLYSWWHQFQSNLILVNLRTDRSGKIVTEQHLLPEGGWFESVSSPHMLFEVLMYMALACLLSSSVTMRYAALWVLTNQVQSAWLTHKWYQQTFGSKYPKRRRAIFPGIL